MVVGFSSERQSVVFLISTHGKMYLNLIQHYVIKFVSDLRDVCGFFRGAPVFSNLELLWWSLVGLPFILKKSDI
jgi:hypothetical protein